MNKNSLSKASVFNDICHAVVIWSPVSTLSLAGQRLPFRAALQISGGPHCFLPGVQVQQRAHLLFPPGAPGVRLGAFAVTISLTPTKKHQRRF